STRTSYKTEYVNETYTAFKTVCVPEQRVITKCVNRVVPEWKEECRTVYKCVPSQETRTITKKVCVCKQVTCVGKECIDCGHWECCLVPKCESKHEKRRRERQCKKDCCCCCPPPMVEKKVWVPNKVWVEKPVTKTVTEVQCVPETITVCVNKLVPV